MAHMMLLSPNKRLSEILREKLGGREPSDNEVNWNLINKALKESDAGNWGAWSSTKFTYIADRGTPHIP